MHFSGVTNLSYCLLLQLTSSVVICNVNCCEFSIVCCLMCMTAAQQGVTKFWWVLCIFHLLWYACTCHFVVCEWVIIFLLISAYLNDIKHLIVLVILHQVLSTYSSKDVTVRQRHLSGSYCKACFNQWRATIARWHRFKKKFQMHKWAHDVLFLYLW